MLHFAAWAVTILILSFQSTCILAETNEAGVRFLESIKDAANVITLPSGLRYKVLKKGSARSHPLPDTPCECHFVGTTPSLTPNAIDKADDEWDAFDSSYKQGKPKTFAPNSVIKGWTEAMQLMVEGDKWEIYIPPDLGYGDSGAWDSGTGNKIKGGDVLIVRVELLKIKGGSKRLGKCNLKSKEFCEPDEVKLLEAWAAKTTDDILQEVKALESRKSDNDLSDYEREKIKVQRLFLMRLIRAKKKDEL